MDVAVELAGVSRVYGLPESTLVALDDVSLAIGRGTFVAVMGVTVVIVTHDAGAAAATDRLLMLRTGRLVDDRPTPDPATIAAVLASASAGVAAVVAR